LLKFRADYQDPPKADGYASKAKKRLKTVFVSLDLDSDDNEAIAAGVAYEALGHGDTLTYADFLIVWKLSPALSRHCPPTRAVVENICNKIEARADSELSGTGLEECCMMLLEVLGKHIPEAKEVFTVGEIEWAQWAAFKKAVGKWQPK